MTNALSSVAANTKPVGSGLLIQKDPIKRIINPLASATPMVSSTSVIAPQPALVASPAVRLNLSTAAQSNISTPQASAQPAAASMAPLNLTMAMGASQTLGYDQQASLVQSFTSPTNQVKITVSLVKGVTYNLSAGYGYSYVPGASTPTFTMTATNPSGAKDTSFSSVSSLSGSFTATSSGNYTLTLTSSAGSSLSSINMQMYAKASLPTNSGDANVDALLQGKNSWWHTPGTAPVQGGAAINGPLKSLVNGSSSTTLTYGFLSAAPTSGTVNDKTGFQSITNPNQKAAVQAALNYISSITNLKFTETDTTTGGQNDSANINFGSNLQSTSDGYAYTPNNSPAVGKTYVYINNKQPSDLGNFTAGTYGWADVFHEIGHALGLKHPGNYNAGLPGNTTGTPPYLDAAHDNHQYSIMSYNNNSYTNGVNNTTYMPYDIEALQYLYGVKTNGSTATAGTFSFANSTPATTYLQTLWSNTGGDQINLAGMSNSSVINLNPGTYSSINIRSNTSNQSNVAIAYGSKINTVSLSTNTTAADKVILNNSYSTGSFDTINNLSANDKIDIKTSIFGNLNATNIAIGANLKTASTASTKLIVNSSTGDIYYDADGNGAASTAVKIARYTKNTDLNIAAANFEFIA